MQIRPISPLFGAEIVEVDLSGKLDDATFSAIEAAYSKYSVLLFRDQKMTDEQHVDFSRRLGELEVHVLREFSKPEHPEVYVLSNIVENGKPIGIKDAGSYWHTDLSYTKSPSRGSILYAIEVPHAADGTPLGDTEFASTAAAYDSLLEEMKTKLQSLKAVHRFWDRYISSRKAAGSEVVISDERRAGLPDVIQPVIRTHSVTGRKSIYVNEGFTVSIVGMSDSESRALLEELYAHCTQAKFRYRHKWRVGDVVMWDNCTTVHRLNVDFALPQRRLMQRTTLVGSEVQ
ncbi:TauD/TfdA family dioxygenase [Polynucleobacter sp. IMCC30063]|uniref:TauD/TfdA dioxygenase family protein n=1 Tax=unclassified Polynucleobacter TaxID=2640945 RepID=UPI001F31E467|nr:MULTISPECIES: TauD/TfdA family dioxygenase [unclassified Polynucleobacter]MCE7505640.1 TauD/TfdA family dioxygenase [Polynucleobacter sp. IMCC30063]MCE7529081.1 TauD/TfdA family dioxygenase [Polynucleobacter sp. IMCC 29146]